MFDSRRVTGFDWDDGNARKSVDKHAVTAAEAEQVFLNDPLLLIADIAHSQSEPRCHALGITDQGRLLHVTFTLRHDETLIRVISARPMSCKEKAHYVQDA